MGSIAASAAESFVFHRDLKQDPHHISSGNQNGFFVDETQEIIDASTGPSVACLGHRQLSVAEAAHAQMKDVSFVYSGSSYTCRAVEGLARQLLEHKPGGLTKAIFVNSGSESTDAALKLATQYWIERGQRQRTNFIARNQSYHGNTLGALSVSGHKTRRQYYAPWLSQNVAFVDPCYAYRGKNPHEDDAHYRNRLLQQFEDIILRLGSDTVAAFIAETVSGTTLGCATAVPGYFEGIRRICDKYDILLILDEIMCGMGKTGTMHAWEQENIRGPDIQTIGKALGAGFLPLSAVLVSQEIFDAVACGSGALFHGHTFQAHAVACAAALEVQTIIQKQRLLQNVQTVGEYLSNELKTQLCDLPFFGDVRGRGLYQAVEFVRDKDKKTPFEVAEKYSDKVVVKARGLGLNILGNLGDTGPHYIDHVIISPRYTVSKDEVRAIVSKLKEVIKEVDKEFLSPSD